MSADSILAARKAALNRELSFFDNASDIEVIGGSDAPVKPTVVVPDDLWDKTGRLTILRR